MDLCAAGGSIVRKRRGTLPVREKGLKARERVVRYVVFMFGWGRECVYLCAVGMDRSRPRA